MCAIARGLERDLSRSWMTGGSLEPELTADGMGPPGCSFLLLTALPAHSFLTSLKKEVHLPSVKMYSREGPKTGSGVFVLGAQAALVSDLVLVAARCVLTPADPYMALPNEAIVEKVNQQVRGAPGRAAAGVRLGVVAGHCVLVARCDLLLVCGAMCARWTAGPLRERGQTTQCVYSQVLLCLLTANSPVSIQKVRVHVAEKQQQKSYD